MMNNNEGSILSSATQFLNLPQFLLIWLCLMPIRKSPFLNFYDFIENKQWLIQVIFIVVDSGNIIEWISYVMILARE